ncbi:hypothetical protein U27_06697 [Candidatus Vecturithrix granuli]|uniref:Bacterial repeat domain-containing protein n=1 Tax=Vecturithrix granuli TaxID=1499967 RepID=A0A081C557_VECG1|nr:hypothetical protein U27_06697 [Candidatus Vecturithrix granuli]
MLVYNSNSGVLSGFTGMANDEDISSGEITFNGAKSSGVTSNIIVLSITFDVIDSISSDLDLEYTAMAAAYTFINLLPVLPVNDGAVLVSPQYRLTVNIEGSGTTIPVAGEYKHDEGTEVELTAEPATATGWHFDS